jgi:hypothetical protein
MWVGVFGIHEWRIGLLPDDGQAESYRIVCRISSYKRASIEESSRGTFFRIPAAMPTYRYLTNPHISNATSACGTARMKGVMAPLGMDLFSVS